MQFAVENGTQYKTCFLQTIADIAELESEQMCRHRIFSTVHTNECSKIKNGVKCEQIVCSHDIFVLPPKFTDWQQNGGFYAKRQSAG